MGNTQVTSLHPVQVAGDIGAPQVVRNESSKTIYYRANPAVSSTLSDGNITEHQEVTVTTPTWFVTAEQVDGEVRVFPADPSSVSGALIDTADIEAKAVTSALVLEATVPVPAAGESLTAVAGTAGVTRTQNFAYTAKAEASAKVKLVHTLNTTAVVVTAYSTTTKLPNEALDFAAEVKGAIAKVKVISATEVELTLAAAVPGAKEEFIYVVAG